MNYDMASKMKPEAYLIEGAIQRHVFIIPLRDGTVQTFVESSGTSNTERERVKSFPGLCYPISHITHDREGHLYYSKLTPVFIRNGEIDARGMERLGKMYNIDDIRVKQDRVFKWEFLLIRDFVHHHDPELWECFMLPYKISTLKEPLRTEMKRKLFKLFHFAILFHQMILQYFATEEQLVCSCVISSESVWNHDFLEMKEFLLRKHPSAEMYRTVRTRRVVTINDEQLMERRKYRNAEIPLDLYVTLRSADGIYEEGVDAVDDPDLSSQPTLILLITNSTHLDRHAPPDAPLALRERIFEHPVDPPLLRHRSDPRDDRPRRKTARSTSRQRSKSKHRSRSRSRD
jgi:hypothetical protein